MIKIIGQAPAPDGSTNFAGKSGERLAALFGMRRDDMRRRFEIENVLRSFPGKSAKGDLFPIGEARIRAKRVRLSDLNLLAGKNVARAFGARPRYFTRQTVRGKMVIVIPHPSGVNHWWNSSANRARAARFFRRLRSCPEFPS